jgi:hypothetical protein
VETREIFETGGAAVLFAAAFLVRRRLQMLKILGLDPRSIISFGAGMSAAYVFVHVMPELAGARHAFVDAFAVPLRYEGMAIYFVALVGFLMFYGLDNVRARLRDRVQTGTAWTGFRLHVGGFAAYVALMAYLLVHRLEPGSGATGLYALVIAFHFLALDHSLQEEHGVAYERTGRFVLAGASLLGWGAGVLFAVPHGVLALLVAFVSGAIMMNSMIMELPSEKEGRFWPFVTGGVVYGLILLPLG